MKPTTGSIDFAESDVEIGYMLQQDFLFPWKTIEDNVALGLKLLKKKKIAQLLMNCSNNSNWPIQKALPAAAFRGMRQRIALARTLAVKPTLLLLDEPFSALDFRSKLSLENFVSDTLKQFSTTTILVTHDISEAIAMSDKVFIFSPRPGTIVKSFIIPQEVRELTPFEARNAPAFQVLFQEIWKELDSDEY